MRARRIGVLGAITGVVSFVCLASVVPPVAARTPAVVGPLSVVGTEIHDSTGVLVLRGIHRDGPQNDADPLRFPSASELAQITDHWNANVVRVPVGSVQWLGRCGVSPTQAETYRGHVDSEIDDITSHGAVALLDLHTVAPGCGQIGRHTMPDQGALDFWNDAALHYASRPLVAFELYNEPHYVTQDVWLNGTDGATQTDCDPHPGVNHKVTGLDPTVPKVVQKAGIAVTLSDQERYAICTGNSNNLHWKAIGMRALYNAVAEHAPGHLVVADGPDWAGSTPDQLLPMAPNGVVYAFHPYVCPNPDDCTAAPLANAASITGWKNWSGARTRPILVSEVGWPVYKDDGSGTYREGAGFYCDTIKKLGGVGIIGFAFDGRDHGAYDMLSSTSSYDPNTTAAPLYGLLTTGSLPASCA
jgi:hypothetical protein